MSSCSEQDDVSDGSNENDGKQTKDENKKGRFMKAFRELFSNPYNPPTIEYGKTVADVPNKKIQKIDSQVLSAYSAPENALEHVHRRVTASKLNVDIQTDKTPIAGVLNWNKKVDKAYGLLSSLYDKVKGTGKKVGDPIADCLAVISRPNNGILALADGVSWGEKSRLAAWCAIYGCVTHLVSHLSQAQTTKDVFRILLDSFQSAHRYITQEDATMSTLCACVVVELQEKHKWGICMVNVGDSLGFIYDGAFGVTEVTVGSHATNVHRDMRFAGGALGPVDGYNPDLSNLTCSYTSVNENCIVFLASDGICDNFDPQVGHFDIPKSPTQIGPRKWLLSRRGTSISDDISNSNTTGASGNMRSQSLQVDKMNLPKPPQDSLHVAEGDANTRFILSKPVFTPEERHHGMQEKLREIIEEGESDAFAVHTARDVCARCMNFALQNTEEKRMLHETEGLSQAEMSKLPGQERRLKEKQLKEKLEATKGKLDHASIVAFIVSFEEEKPFALFRNGTDCVYEDLPSTGSPETAARSSPNRVRVPKVVKEEVEPEKSEEGVEMKDMTSKRKEMMSKRKEAADLAYCTFK